MPVSRRSLLLGSAASGAAALGLAACEGDSQDPGTGASDAGGSDGSTAVLRINGTEPATLLVPSDVNEVGSGRVIGGIFSMLLFHDATGTRVLEGAKAIESDDNQHWTITLEPGRRFSDGTPVTASSYVDAWNFGALSTNAQKNQAFYSAIEGFDAVSATPPTATTMSGLQVVDDETFTVALSWPQSDFPDLMGCVPFMPLPAVAYDDIPAFSERPVGNGPYVLTSWEHERAIELGINEHYEGPRTAANGGIVLRSYTDPETAYNDLLTGELDLLDGIPASALATFQDELGDRAVNQPGALLMSMTIPVASPDFTGEAGRLRRAAVSRAIDRAAICEALYSGTRVPATDFVCPTIAGGGATDIPGAEVLAFDAAVAKDLWAQAEAIAPYSGAPFTLDYTAELPDREWVEAVCAGVRANLGIEAVPQVHATVAEYRALLAERKIPGAFRSSWQADYPSMYNFLGPIFSSAARASGGTNFSDYANPAFDDLLVQGLAAPDADAAIALWKQAQAMLMTDLPAIPLWYQNTLGGSGEGVRDVTFGWNSFPFYFEASKG